MQVVGGNSSSLSCASSVPSSSERITRALSIMPGCGLASKRNALKWPRLPISACEAIDVHRSDTNASSRVSATARTAKALMKDVPLVSASPSLASSSSGSRSREASTSLASRTSPSNNTSVSPVSVRPTYDSGTRSPLAPHEPRSGIKGRTSWLISSISRSTSSTRTPELPLARQFARISIVARVTSGEAYWPVPAPRKRSMFCCSRPALAGAICRCALSPKPVVTP